MTQAFSVRVRIKTGPLLIDESILVATGLDILTLEKEAEETGNFEVVSSHPVTLRTGVEAIDLITKLRESVGAY
jgi:hypothetical protein